MEMVGLASLASRRRQIKSAYSLARWPVRSASLSLISVSSGMRFTRLNHSLTVGSSSRSSTSDTLDIFFNSVMGGSRGHAMLSVPCDLQRRTWQFKKLAKIDLLSSMFVGFKV